MKKNEAQFKADSPEGAWRLGYEGQDFVILLQDGYCMFTQYSLPGKKFVLSSGGPYTIEDGKIKIKIQFNSADQSDVGKEHAYEFALNKDELITRMEDGGFSLTWKRIDAGGQNLAGNWRITQRKQGDEMADIPLRARRTLKLLTATRFQWAAINIETGEFSGTGGGTYTFKDGRYTENIEFFSRDSSRVGMSLSFDGKLENGDWIHSGKSSKGDPIYEIWSRMKE
ncbi:hypothetical protein GCM10027516_34550 [Niabella aquatica]